MSAWSWAAADVRPPWRRVVVAGLVVFAALAVLAIPAVPGPERAGGILVLLVGMLVWAVRRAPGDAHRP